MRTMIFALCALLVGCTASLSQTGKALSYERITLDQDQWISVRRNEVDDYRCDVSSTMTCEGIDGGRVANIRCKCVKP